YTANLWVTITGVGSPAVYPEADINCTVANAADDAVTFTFGTVAITLTEGVDFDRGGSNTACAAALAAAIEANPILNGVMSVVPSGGNIAITGRIPGSFLHDVTLSTTDATG